MSLPERVRAALTLTRFQALIGITAGVLSISATVGGALYASRPPVTTGEVVATVVDARTDQPLPNSIVELLTPQNALVATLLAKDGQARQTVKEGLYRLRALHPKFMVEVRPIYVIAGHSQPIRVRLAPPPPPPRPVAVEKAKAPDKDKEKTGPFDKLKKLFH